MEYKLKPIPSNIVVHTTTEAEAKELLEILHENGYEWYHKNAPIPNPNLKKVKWINIYNSLHGCSKVITYCDRMQYLGTILTLAEFKEEYCEEEKPQPKYYKGDKVIYKGKPYTIEAVTNMGSYYLYSIDTEECDHLAALPVSDLEPYTEPTEESDNLSQDVAICDNSNHKDMETNQLNLCEILRCHEGERFYCLMWGEADVVQFYPNGLRIATCTDHDTYLNIDEQGKYYDDGVCILYPSLALYEQYPLEPCTAWQKWEESQKKFALKVECRRWNEDEVRIGVSEILRFATSADRDKAIEEIKSVIEKYNKG